MMVMMAVIALSLVPTPAKAASVPGVPIGFSVTTHEGTVRLAWSEPTDNGGSAITGYRVYRGMMEDGLGIVEDVTDMHYEDTALSSGQTYYYAVTALNVEGEGEKTEVLSVTPQAPGPLMTLIHVEDYTTVTIINVGEGVYFDIAGGRQNVTVESITGTNALISVNNGALEYTMKEGDSKSVDVNDDGTDDFVITCETIRWSNTETVEFSFTKASKEPETGTGIPGFEPWTIAVGGIAALGMRRLKMKKLSIFMIFLVLTTFTVSPILAAKNTWDIEYTFDGTIWDMDSTDPTRGGGWMTMTLSGKIIGAPDYEYTKTVVDEPVWYGYGEGSGYTYWEDEDLYLIQYNTEATVEGVASYTEHRAKWYSPQPTFNGKIIVNYWGEDSTESFNVALSPSKIEQVDREGTITGIYTYRTVETLYIENEDGNWEWVEETVIAEGSEPFAESYDDANIQIQFQGKMNGKGEPPLKGTLEIYDVVSGNYKIGYGEFGPYMISIFQQVS